MELGNENFWINNEAPGNSEGTYYCGDDYHGDMDDDLFEDVFDYNEMGILFIR